MRKYVVPQDMEALQRAAERAQQDRKPFTIDYRINRADDGSERWISGTGRYLFDEEGKPVRLLGIVSDITERKRLEQRVRQSQKLDALGTLAGGIAHDFNNILSILRGNLLLIEADLPADHPIAPAITEMSRACARARDLVRQILTFGRQQEQDRKLVSLGRRRSRSAEAAALDDSRDHRYPQPRRAPACRPCWPTRVRSIRS